MKKITLLVPCYNEEAVLNLFYEKTSSVVNNLIQYHFEFFFVNDGSNDNTLEIMKSLRARDERVSYIDFSRNFGKEAAMIAGMDFLDCDAVVIMDADLQHPPELIPQMLEAWEDSYADVYAMRQSRDGESFLKKFGSKLYYALMQRIARFSLQPNVGDFRLLDRQALEAMRSLRETHRYTKGMFSWIGFRKKAIPYEVQPRAAGETKWNYLKLLNLAIEGVMSYSTLPLRMASITGLCVAGTGFVYMIFTIIKTILFGDPAKGYPTMVTLILLIGGIQIMFLGIIGEYLGRIFNETKNRPLYLVQEYNGEKVLYSAGKKNL